MSLRSATFVVASLALAGCAGNEDDDLHLAVARQAVQTVWVGSNEGVTSTGVNLLLANSQSRKGRATGAIRLPVKGLNFSCGVTFVSHHFAITAAHCVDDTDVTLNQSFVVEQYNTVNLNMSAYFAQVQVTGTWPDYRRPNKLSAANGYIVKPTNCHVVSRCHVKGDVEGQYGNDNCPFSSPAVDIALLQCDRTPNGVDWVPISASEPLGNVEVWWFHEVLNMGTSSVVTNPYQPANNWAHYGQYFRDNLGTNYHYAHTAVDTNSQLLPLVSKHSSSNVPYRALSLTGTTTVKTDLPVCHGTSGSGFFRANTDEFLGVTALFGTSFSGTTLCETMTSSSEGNGSGYTQRQWAQSLFANRVPVNDRL